MLLIRLPEPPVRVVYGWLRVSLQCLCVQTSYAITADLPEFRKNKEYSAKFRVPFAFPTYTAYVEVGFA